MSLLPTVAFVVIDLGLFKVSNKAKMVRKITFLESYKAVNKRY